MNSKSLSGLLSVLVLGAGCLVGSAEATDLFDYNFEAAGAGGATTIPAPPWQMSSEVFSSAGAYLGGYYPGFTFGPNAIVSGESGAAQGTYVGKIWPNYDYAPDWTDNKIATISLYVNRVLTSGDIAQGRIEMTFDSKLQPDIGPSSTATGWVKLFNSNYSQFWGSDTVTLSGSEWTTRTVGMNLDPNDTNLIGANFQWGFTVGAQNYSANGLFVDNVTVSAVPEPSAYALAVVGVVGLGALRRRRG